MKINELTLFSIINTKKSLDAYSKKYAHVFLTKHSKTLFSGFRNNLGVKYYHITDTSKDRINCVPIDKIDANSLIDLKERKSCGLVYFNDGLHFMYLIRDNGVYIMTSRQKRKRIVEDVDFHASQLISSIVYFDFFSNGKSQYINNVLDFIINKDTLLINEPTLRPIFKKMGNPDSEGHAELIANSRKDWEAKYNDSQLCLKAFMFIHFAKTIDTTRISQSEDNRSVLERLKNVKQTNIEIIQVDTYYDENMKVINPFSVSGHFRNQPIGEGRKETKSIYIDSFMKSGYTRNATITKQNEKHTASGYY
jgi:hypothetical protein